MASPRTVALRSSTTGAAISSGWVSRGRRLVVVMTRPGRLGEAVRRTGPPVGLRFGVGVVVLGLQGGPELNAGLEERAGLTDRFEGAVQLGRSGAVAVAEQAVVLAAQVGPLGSC